MTVKNRIYILSSCFLFILSTLITASCAPVVHSRGHIVQEDKLDALRLDKTTKTQLVSILGTPTTRAPFDENIWYYIGETTETTAFFRPDVVERKILKVAFNENGRLDEMTIIDETAGTEIMVLDKTTPTAGVKMTILQQFLGNIGRFNKQGAR